MDGVDAMTYYDMMQNKKTAPISAVQLYTTTGHDFNPINRARVVCGLDSGEIGYQ